MSDVCRSCGAPIRWVLTATGQRMPLNVDPDGQRGNVLVCDTPALARAYAVPPGHAVVLSAGAAAGRRLAGLDLHLSHFATCASAAQHRRKR
jgi:hypothetical protein